MSSSIDVPLKNGGFGQTRRKDTWWIEPLLVFLGFSAFIVYSTWAALQNCELHTARHRLFVADVLAAADDRRAFLVAGVSFPFRRRC